MSQPEPKDLSIESTLALRTGAHMPRLGLGVFKAGAHTAAAVKTALELGYRHLDTAAIYKNEADVAKGLAESGVPRDQVFITTKLWNDDQGYDEALRAFDQSLSRLGTDYVDLYLIHWPLPERRLRSWKALERLHEEGRAKAIGVSNFLVKHLEELLTQCQVPPAVNQIELHPYLYLTRRPTLDYCRANDIVVTAYSPLTKGRKLDDKRLGVIAAKAEKTPAQVLIRWALQKGVVVIPKSSSPERIRENADVFGWSLTDGMMEALDALDEGLTTAWDPAEED